MQKEKGRPKTRHMDNVKVASSVSMYMFTLIMTGLGASLLLNEDEYSCFKSVMFKNGY